MNKSYFAIIPANVRYDQELTASAKLLYGEITALCNEKGYCWATNAYFANLYGVTKTSISQWIQQLAKKGYITTELIRAEGTQEILHRYIRIFTEPPQINLHTPTQEILQENNTKIFNTTINNTRDKKKNAQRTSPAEYEGEFEQLWQAYPRKKDKARAKRAYLKARKSNKATFEKIREGLELYQKYIKAQGIQPEYVKHGSTWFNNECWNDEHNLEPAKGKDAETSFFQLCREILEEPQFIREEDFSGERRGRQTIFDYQSELPEPL